MQDDAPKGSPSHPSPDSPEAEALQRKAFGKSIAAFQLTQEKLADMATRLLQGQLLAGEISRSAIPDRASRPERPRANRNGMF